MKGLEKQRKTIPALEVIWNLFLCNISWYRLLISLYFYATFPLQRLVTNLQDQLRIPRSERSVDQIAAKYVADVVSELKEQNEELQKNLEIAQLKRLIDTLTISVDDTLVHYLSLFSSLANLPTLNSLHYNVGWQQWIFKDHCQRRWGKTSWSFTAFDCGLYHPFI